MPTCLISLSPESDRIVIAFLWSPQSTKRQGAMFRDGCRKAMFTEKERPGTDHIFPLRSSDKHSVIAFSTRRHFVVFVDGGGDSATYVSSPRRSYCVNALQCMTSYSLIQIVLSSDSSSNAYVMFFLIWNFGTKTMKIFSAETVQDCSYCAISTCSALSHIYCLTVETGVWPWHWTAGN